MTFALQALRRSATLRTILVYASGNTLAMGLGVVGSFVQARYIGPEDMGVFRTFGIAAGYLTFLQIGVFDGLQREIPLQLGRGEQAKAERAAAACLAWILFVSIACGAIFLALAVRAAMHREWMQFWGWLAYIPVIIATFYGGYLGTTFRTGQQFIRLSKTSVIQAIVGSLILPLMPLMGYFGACLRTAVTSLSGLLLLHRWRPMRVAPPPRLARLPRGHPHWPAPKRRGLHPHVAVGFLGRQLRIGLVRRQGARLVFCGCFCPNGGHPVGPEYEPGHECKDL